MSLSPISHRERTLVPSTAASSTDFNTPEASNEGDRVRKGAREGEGGRE